MPTPQEWNGNYAYSSGVGRKLCLLMGVKNPPIHTPHDLHRFGSLQILPHVLG
jgi:hypothetical protein